MRTVALLLDGGQNIDQLGDMGCTALHYAFMRGHEEVVGLLLSRGADTCIRNSFGQLPNDCRASS